MTEVREDFSGDTAHGGPGAASPLPPHSEPEPLQLNSEQLLQGRRIVEIRHNGEVYRLQATRLGKLILTK
ncbi:MAG: hemin uptake protein HemP [Ramlibacter sp.]